MKIITAKYRYRLIIGNNQPYVVFYGLYQSI